MSNLMEWTFVLLAQVPANSAAAPSTAAPLNSSAQIESVWDFVVKGGPVMIPIGLCSLVALAVIIERWITLRRKNVIPSAFLPGLQSILNNGGTAAQDRKRALEYCQSHSSAVANVFAAGIKRLGHPIESIEKNIQEAGEREVLKLRKFLRMLSVIGSVSPLLGLLGTILGMITAFQTVAASGEALGRTELLAKGIYQAMITTAAGLLVAIPVLICYHWIAAKVDRLVAEIDRMSVDFVEQYAQSPEPQPAADSFQAASINGEPAPARGDRIIEPAPVTHAGAVVAAS